VQRHIDPSTGYIRGVAACASQWAENNNTWSIQPLSFNYTGTCAQTSFLQVPTYGALTNTVYTGIRIPSNEQFDSNLSKNFGIIRDALKLQLRLEAFNTFNHPLWQENYEGSTQDSNFGTIEKGPWGQSNLPREVQIAVKLMW
jgi:hypothetical protein